MPVKYLDLANGDLREKFKTFMEKNNLPKAVAVDLAYIVNVAVRCSPRNFHATCRQRIVAAATKDFCDIGMTKEIGHDGYTYNIISIVEKL